MHGGCATVHLVKVYRHEDFECTFRPQTLGSFPAARFWFRVPFPCGISIDVSEDLFKPAESVPMAPKTYRKSPLPRTNILSVGGYWFRGPDPVGGEEPPRNAVPVAGFENPRTISIGCLHGHSIAPISTSKSLRENPENDIVSTGDSLIDNPRTYDSRKCFFVPLIFSSGWCWFRWTWSSRWFCACDATVSRLKRTSSEAAFSTGWFWFQDSEAVPVGGFGSEDFFQRVVLVH